jgi:hypothetical protein
MAKNKYQVRFNLGRGDNYMKWKVSTPSGEATYHNPDDVLIVMKGCKLFNQKGSANKIYEGANKTVCAWVECDNVDIIDKVIGHSSARKVCYNPRVKPNWELDGENVDKSEFDELFTVKNTVRVTE